ncbi:glycoside hydrolase family 95 protein [Parabacteroides sp. OttesenSCG-928-K15]|nr:glycoside hydrolase family 95 protein [Parabacteroides sp. OttesenSCG-928-K15]
MKLTSLLPIVLLFLLFTGCQQKENNDLTLWYNSPASNWNEAMPIGNGHAGAMVFGGAKTEQLSLNENTLYSGEPSGIFKDIKVTPEQVDKVVDLLKKEKYTEAYDVISRHWLGRLHQYYQPFGDLFIENNREGEITDYRRELNLSESLTTTEFKQGETTYKREVFASHPDKVIVIRLTSDRKEGIDVTLNFTSPHPTAQQTVEENLLTLKGKAPGYVERRTFEQMEAWGDQHKHPELYDEKGNRKFDKRVLYGDEIDNLGMLFEAQLKPFFPAKGSVENTGSGMRIYNTHEVYLVMAMATSYNGYDKSPSREGIDPTAKAAGVLAAIQGKDYKTLKRRHTEDYQNLFRRVSLSLASTAQQKELPTDERIIRFAQQADPDLAALLFQFGRYLMISGSRPGGQPLNLQGMWNKEIVPPWNSGYTQNINTEMNYWPAEVTNLAECHEPLFTMIQELAQTGAETAREMYGRRGWVGHHNTSLWRESQPNDNVATASFWPMVQGWYGSHLWEHYLYTDDKDFLRTTAYPILKGAAEFYADWLVEHEGHLVTPAGVSPENAFLSDNGQRGAISMGPTMDMILIRETFTRTLEAAELLNVDAGFRKEIEEKLPRLLPYRIGAKGQLQEWMYDFKEVEPKHRHISHLYGLYPGDQITPDKTPELFKAVETTLNLRGDEATGWSMGWKINCWARLLDGNRAYKIVANLFNPIDFGPEKKRGGGLYRSMLDAHPPFQIDGNFGYTAGIAEMLMQSHAGFIHLLPALPDVWAEGEIKGLKARGNFELSIIWNNQALQQATLVSHAGNPATLRSATPFTVRKDKKDVTASTPIETGGRKYYQATFDTDKGDTYNIVRAD